MVRIEATNHIGWTVQKYVAGSGWEDMTSPVGTQAAAEAMMDVYVNGPYEVRVYEAVKIKESK